MKRISVVKFVFGEDYPGLAEVSAGMDNLSMVNRIDNLNWDTGGYKPELKFKIAYGKREIYLKYYAREEYVKAEKTGVNQDVYEDSCVEFFVSPAGDGIYYNFEFNSIGAFLFGSGTGRHDSRRSDPAMASMIRCLPSLGYEPFPERKGRQEWTLTIAIDLAVFFRHDIKSLEGREFRANFYKCGDALTKPHYLSWNPVLVEKPDFHRPEFFGSIYFE
ncbi:MAG: carbohydrate-binding family 9-like protein [Bacteroidales bacterium]|nr:carbohydrate-binding family 9-like protein [Bacteroidales bacterium]